MKKQKAEQKKTNATLIDWDEHPEMKAMMARLDAQRDQVNKKREDLTRFALAMDKDPITNAYQFISYYYEQYNRYYGEYEFLVLMASRGADVTAYKKALFKGWKTAAEQEKESRSMSSHYNAETGKQETKKTNIDDIWPYPEFWRGDKNEQNTIDATMLRVVDHFSISGFDGYWNVLEEELYLSVDNESESLHIMAQYLFSMCRTAYGGNLMYNRMAIIIELILHGKDPKVNHFWEFRRLNRDGMKLYNSPYIAAGVMFSILRMGLAEKYSDILDNCEKYLSGSQMSDGGWKTVSLHDTTSIDTTAVCVHALAMFDSDKHRIALDLATEFLLAKQDKWWLWEENANPYVSYLYLSVEVLDALELARENSDVVTFSNVTLHGANNLTAETISKQIESTTNNIIMGDVNNFTGGQFGAVGSNAKVENNVFNQANYNFPENYDYGKLSSELEILKNAMKGKAESADQYVALGEVASAEQAANNKEGKTVAKKLLGAGKWALETAKEIGVGVVVDLINKQIPS